jgi:hypothetical protein
VGVAVAAGASAAGVSAVAAGSGDGAAGAVSAAVAAASEAGPTEVAAVSSAAHPGWLRVSKRAAADVRDRIRGVSVMLVVLIDGVCNGLEASRPSLCPVGV